VRRLQKFLDFGFSLQRLFFVVLAVFALLYTCVGPLVGFGVHGNALTAVLAVSLTLIVAIGLKLAPRYGALPLMLMFSFATLEYFFPRILEYLTMSRETLKNLYVFFPQMWDADLINIGLNFVVVATLAAVMGLLAGGRLTQFLYKNQDAPPPPPPPKKASIKSLAFAGLVIVLIEGYFCLYQGLSASSNCIQFFFPGVWLIHFFSSDLFGFVIIVILIMRIKDLKRSEAVFLWASVALYLVYMVLLGSRGGVLRVVTISFAVWVAVVPFPTLRLRWLLALIVPVGLSALVTFAAGSLIRANNVSTCAGEKIDAVKTLQEDYSVRSLGDKYVNASTAVRNKHAMTLHPFLAQVGDRLGEIDYPIGVVAMPGNQEAIKKYMNVSYMAKNFWNNLVIGEPYPEARYMTDNMMAIIYRGRDFDFITKHYQADAWTIFGSCFILLGYWGGVAMIFFVSLALQVSFEGVCRATPAGYRAYVRAIYAWIVVLGVVYFQMSPDHAAILLVYLGLQFATTMALIYGPGIALEKIRDFRGRSTKPHS
jgi:hypothetical protein